MSDTLEQVLADARGEIPVLRKRNGSWDAAAVLEFVDRVTASAEPWLTWLSEGDATIRCGFTTDWLRTRYPQWERDGNARTSPNGKDRQYRACIIPRRANVAMAAEAGRAAALAAREDSRKSA